ncbi:MAG: hypothetical protein Q8S75_09280 [Nitrospirota bacterium]|nr:hypothetical protein [Nitrospirota bacterium]
MRIHLRLNPAKEQEQLIARWLARYHRGATRHAVIKACLAAGARAYLVEGLARKAPPAPTAPAPKTHTMPVTIPTFAGLGALIQTQQPPRTTTRLEGPDDTRQPDGLASDQSR